VKQYYPPMIKEIILPPEFEQDYDLQEQIMEDKMMMSYAWVMLLFCLILIIVVIM